MNDLERDIKSAEERTLFSDKLFAYNTYPNTLVTIQVDPILTKARRRHVIGARIQNGTIAAGFAALSDSIAFGEHITIECGIDECKLSKKIKSRLTSILKDWKRKETLL